MRKFFRKLYIKLFDRDKDGDVDKDDLLIVAKKLLMHYGLTSEEADQVLGITKHYVIGEEALNRNSKEGVNKAQAAGYYIEETPSRGTIATRIAAIIYQLFRKRMPMRVINFVIEAIVNLLAKLGDDIPETPEEPENPLPDTAFEYNVRYGAVFGNGRFPTNEELVKVGFKAGDLYWFSTVGWCVSRPGTLPPNGMDTWVNSVIL